VDNINVENITSECQMDLTEIGGVGMDWINLAQERDQWWTGGF
jgi:hypothetical protein